MRRVGVILVVLSVIGILIISTNAQIASFVQIITAISWREDSEQFVIAYGWQRFGEGECPTADLILYDLNGTSKALKSTQSCMITGAVYSSDYSNIISTGIDGTTILWDATTLNEIQSSLYFGSITALSISPKINQIAVLRDGARIKITRIDSNQFGDSIILGEGISYITDIAWHPEGGIIATSDLDGFIKFWDAEAASRLGIIEFNPSSGKTSLAISPVNPDEIAFGDEAGTATIWNILEAGVKLSLTGHGDVVNKLDWSADGTRIASASDDGTVRIWDAETGKLLETLTYPGPVYALDWSPDGTKLAYGGADLSGGVPEVKIVDVADIGLTPEATQEAVPTP